MEDKIIATIKILSLILSPVLFLGAFYLPDLQEVHQNILSISSLFLISLGIVLDDQGY